MEMLGQELGAGTLEQMPRMTLTYLQGREPSVLRTVTTGSAHWDRNDTKPHTEKATRRLLQRLREKPPQPRCAFLRPLLPKHRLDWSPQL